jgi:hypothetical protein
LPPRPTSLGRRCTLLRQRSSACASSRSDSTGAASALSVTGTTATSQDPKIRSRSLGAVTASKGPHKAHDAAGTSRTLKSTPRREDLQAHRSQLQQAGTGRWTRLKR